MAMIRGKMVSTDGKVIYCTCEHHKVAVPTRPEHLKKEFEEKPDKGGKEEGVGGKGEGYGIRREKL